MNAKENELCVVTDYAEGGDMFEVIKKHQKKRTFVPEPRVWDYLEQITTGLKVLHDLNVVHRDLKGANILLNKTKTIAKVADMNVSKVAKNKYLYTQTGTPYYASPEVWRDEPYDKKSDIWSLGCLIYEVCALRPPFSGKDMEDLFSNVQK